MTTNRRRLLLVLLVALVLPSTSKTLPINEESQLRRHQQRFCNEQHVATAYSYNSVIGGFSNISKTLHFTAQFTISCEKFDGEDDLSYYTITFSKIATKMKPTDKPSDKNESPRRRKMPSGFDTGSAEKMAAESVFATTASTTTTTTASQPIIHVIDKTTHDGAAASAKDNVWYDMPAWPVKFAQHLNGTIVEIYIKAEDHASKSEVANLKKSIALLFQTNRDQATGSIVESDDLGMHYSEYSYKASPLGDLLIVHKTVTPDDFVRMQLDALNAEKLEIFVNQYQRIRTDDWATESVNGRVATYPIEQSTATSSQKMPFSVEVTYSLKMTRDGVPVFLERAGTEGFVRVPNTNFTSQEYDTSELLAKILSKKEESARKREGGIPGLIAAVAKSPQTAMKEANLLRSLIGLESKIYLLNSKKGRQPLLKEIVPLVDKQMREDRDKERWDSALKMLYIVSSGVGFEIDNFFIKLLNDTDLMESSFRPQFLNTLIQFEHPTDRLIEVILEMLPNSDSMSITEHHLSLAVSSLIAKDSDAVSTPVRVRVMIWFQKMIAPLQRCPPSQDVYKIFLESIANFLTAESIAKIGEPAAKLMDILINIVKGCRTGELSVEAMNSLRNCLNVEAVQVALAETLRADDTPCNMRGGLVDALLVAMELSSSSGIGRSWPRYGTVPSIDGFILTEWVDAPGSINAFSCNKQPIARYLVKKKGRDWHNFLLGYLYKHGNVDEEELPALGVNGSSLLIRRRREDPGANPLAGLGGGLAGGLGGFVFTPEVDCDNWNSAIGVNYTEIYENPVEFDNDIRHFSAQKRHCLFRAEFKATLLSGGLKAGFFAGRNERGESKLFGRAWMGVRLLVQMEIAVVQFLREQTQKGFQGHVLLRALSNVYLHEVQYACNLTINDWTYGWQYTTPAFRVTFGGFAFLMNADFDIRFNLTLWPSFCGPDGSMGIRFRPITIVEADAYAELENDFFGLGALATLYLNYYLDTQMSVPSGCFYLYHGNDDMFFKFDFYLKLPSFVFINFEPSPVVLKQPFPVLTWQLMIKKSSRYVLLGWCLPNTFQGPETPRWEIE